MLGEVASVMGKDDLQRSEAVLDRARELDERVRGFYETLSAGHETARLSSTRRRSIKHLQLYSGASLRIELAAINTRVLACGTYNAIRHLQRHTARRRDTLCPAGGRTRALAGGRAPRFLPRRNRRSRGGAKLGPGGCPAVNRGAQKEARPVNQRIGRPGSHHGLRPVEEHGEGSGTGTARARRGRRPGFGDRLRLCSCNKPKGRWQSVKVKKPLPVPLRRG